MLGMDDSLIILGRAILSSEEEDQRLKELQVLSFKILSLVVIPWERGAVSSDYDV